MKVFKYLFFLVLIAVIGLCVYIAIQKSDYNVASSKLIKAPAEVIFEDINELKNWQYWGPWKEEDPTIVASYPEKTSGVGGSYSWTGREGDGNIKTISLVPNKEIIQEIDFGRGKPATVYWNFEEKPEGTNVTWGMKGESSFMEKAFLLFSGGIEKMVKPMYDRGLVLYDQYIKKEINKTSFEHKGMVEHGGGFYLYQTTSCKMEDVSTKMAQMFRHLNTYIAEKGITPNGKPFTLTHKWDDKNKTSMFSSCIPVKEKMRTTNDVLIGFLPSQKTYKTIYNGNYNDSYKAWENAFTTLAKEGFKSKSNGEAFEVYTVNPNDTKNPAKWITEIYIPIE